MTEASESELQRAVDRLTSVIEQLRVELVRKDVYESDQRSIEARMTNIAQTADTRSRGIDEDLRSLAKQVQTAEDRRAADRRLLLTAIVIPMLLFIVQLYIAASLPGGAG